MHPTDQYSTQPIEEYEEAEEIDPSSIKKSSKLPQDLEPEWTMGSIYDAYTALVELGKGSTKFPFKLAWQLDDMQEALKPYAAKFESRQQDLLSRYGTRVENPNLPAGQLSFTLTHPQEYQAASRALSLLTAEDFNTNAIKPIPVKELEKVEDLKISTTTLKTLRNLGLVTVEI